MEISVSIEPFLKGDGRVLKKYLEDIITLRGRGVSVHFDFFDYNKKVLDLVGGYSDNIDIHLHSTVGDIDRLVGDLGKYKFASVSVHSEKILNLVCVMGKTNTRYGVVLNLGTEVKDLGHFTSIIKQCEFATVMTVKCGASGQAFNASALGLIKAIKKINPFIRAVVDGGVNDTNIAAVKAAGADIAVVGSYAKKCYEAEGLEKGLNRLLQSTI